MNIGFVMPVIAAIGSILIVIVLLAGRNAVEREQIKSIDVEKFNRIADDLLQQNTEIKRELKSIREKVDSIDKMMKDI